MKAYLKIAAVAAFGIAIAAPASAEIVVCNGQSCLSTDENVLLSDQLDPKTIAGVTNQSGGTITFTSAEEVGIVMDANGQASISAADGRLGSLRFDLSSGTFGGAVFNLSPVPGNRDNEAISAVFTFLGADGNTISLSKDVTLSTNGNNWFGVSGNAGERLTGISFLTNNHLTDGIGSFQQLRLSDVQLNSAVPEPATWAMMLFGFGAVGYSMRSRRRVGYNMLQVV